MSESNKLVQMADRLKRVQELMSNHQSFTPAQVRRLEELQISVTRLWIATLRITCPAGDYDDILGSNRH